MFRQCVIVFVFHFIATVESGDILLSMKSLNIGLGNQNPYIEEEQTTQWPQNKYKWKNNDLQNIHLNLKI